MIPLFRCHTHKIARFRCHVLRTGGSTAVSQTSLDDSLHSSRGRFGDYHYQGSRRQVPKGDGNAGTSNVEQPVPAIMPNLEGLSLRKSLRLLRGIPLKINIQGTGRVVDQKPPAGAALKGMNECLLILERNENINLKKLSKELTPKK